MVEIARRLGASVVVDPWQAALMGQRLRARGVAVTEYSFSGDSRRKLFASVLDLVRGGRLRCRPHDDLRRELLAWRSQETAAGGAWITASGGMTITSWRWRWRRTRSRASRTTAGRCRSSAATCGRIGRDQCEEYFARAL